MITITIITLMLIIFVCVQLTDDGCVEGVGSVVEVPAAGSHDMCES